MNENIVSVNNDVANNFKILMHSMLTRESIAIIQDTHCADCGSWTGIDKDYGIVNEIQAEDGSGRNFNITLHTGKTFFLKLTRPGCVTYDIR